ncbi:MAG: choice-of-anchor I family protein [Phaeodactylibacter sp.]|nr:choice-of-anchor I family protein [Phaeodactylibacter sp.]
MAHVYPLPRALAFLAFVAFLAHPLLAQDTRELFQGFEGTAGDTWNYAVSPPRYVADGGDDVWADTTSTEDIQPATGQKFWFMRDLDNDNGGLPGFHTLDFEPVDLSGFAFNSVSFKYYTIEYDDNDSIGYILETGAGAGFDMANYVSLDRNTNAWTTVFLNLPPGAAVARLRLMAKQNGTNDLAGFDDVAIFSSTMDVVPPLVLGAELTGPNSLRINYSEPMDEASVEDPANYTSNAAISNLAYANPGSGASYVDVTFNEEFVAGQAYSLSVELVTDAAGNFLAAPFTFDFIYNNTLPALVITEIFYHPPSDESQEFIEIYNAGDSSAALGGLQVSGEFSFTFPAGLVLPAGEVVLLAYDEAVAEAFFGEDFLSWGAVSSLGNGGGDIIITNFSGAIIDQVNYEDGPPWPEAPDGTGPSLELASVTLDNNNGLNWRASITRVGNSDVFATPGITSEDLTPIIGFTEASVAWEEGAGRQSLFLSINNPDAEASRAILTVASASTALSGVDYILGQDTITFPASSADLQAVSIEILDNADPGGRYLILEIAELINGEPGSNDRVVVLIKDNDIVPPAAPASPTLKLAHLGSYESGASAGNVAHDPGSQRLFVANSAENRLDIIDFSAPASLGPVNSIDLSALYNGQASAIAVHDGIVAVAMAASAPGDNGAVLFFETNGFLQSAVRVGASPDKLAFTPDGSRLVVANEGIPGDDYAVDPEGSVSIIDITPGVGNLMNSDVTAVGFAAFNPDSASLVARGVRLFGPGATVAQDLEPEHVAISDDGATAFVVCQENNALIVVDLETATATDILPFGFKDWSEEGVLFDASDQSPDIFFANWPVKGMYQPGGIDYFTVGGQAYLITANEGDARDYDAFSEAVRVGDIDLDPNVFPHGAYLQDDALLGRLHVAGTHGDPDGDGDYDELYAFGGRSYSIWNAGTGSLVYDSGGNLEMAIANDPDFGQLFNTAEDENRAKGRSDDEGPEPKSVAVGLVNGVPHAFVAMEPIGGVMVFELSDPAAPKYVQYINTRNLFFPGGDLGPESIVFIAADDSPNGKPMLAVGHKASGTLAIFEIGTGPTVAFTASSTIVPEGSGRLEVEVRVEVEGALTGEVAVSIISASTAVEGEDFTLASTTLSFPENTSAPQVAVLNILDNGARGGRYLILELERPDGSQLTTGSKNRHIVLIQDTDDAPPAPQDSPRALLSHVGSFAFPAGASAGAIAYAPATSRLYVANPGENNLEVLNFSNPASIQVVARINLDAYGGAIRAVDFHDGILAVALQGDIATDPGQVVFLDANGAFISSATVGALPGMLLFSPDGTKVLTADEGEPSDDYAIDPEGSASIVDISGGVLNPVVTTLGFTAFNAQRADLAAQGVRLFGPGATVAQDLEPEHITISDDGATAYITCQENNALAVADLTVPEIRAILPLGHKDWSAEGATLDASDRSGDIFLANWPVRGMYQPDAIDYFTAGGRAYLITANEGDPRDYGGFSEEIRVGDDAAVLDSGAFPDAEYLKEDVLLGRLRVSRAAGDTDGDGDLDELYAFGGRSFSIWDATAGTLVYDSGNSLEQITAADPVFGSVFNADYAGNEFKNRSDDRGPEPEAVVVAGIGGRPYAFIGLERIGGIVMYSLADPAAPEFVQYVNTRTANGLGGDRSPEDIIYVSSEDSPTGKPYLLASHEASGSVAVFEVNTAATAGFARSGAVVEEGAGEVEIELAVGRAGVLSGEAVIRIAGASTAREGEDFILSSSTVSFEAGSSASQVLRVDIPDNAEPGGRYLILEIDPASSSAIVGDTSRYILLIKDNDDPPPAAQPNPYLQLDYLGSYSTPYSSEMEMVAYDAQSRRLFVSNPAAALVEILDYSTPGNIVLVDTISIAPYGAGPGSVAARDGVVAVAVPGHNTGDNGKVVFFDADGVFLHEVQVGAMPGMVCFSPDGSKLVTANEGEPSADYSVDPEGSVSIIDINGGVAGATVATLGFEAFNSQQASLEAQGVRIFGPNATVAQDLEPESVAISDDGRIAYVTCQENNALAVVDLIGGTVAGIWPLRTKDWTRPGTTFDASDESGDVFFANWPVKGMYQPDGIDYFSVGGVGYLITANEGDARAYDAFSEELRVGDDEVVLDPTAFPDAEYLKEDALLGRLRITSAAGDTDGDGDYDELHAYGGRSFTIRSTLNGGVIYDSGNDLEQITAADPGFGALFNSNDEENEFKGRSADKGPEPESVVVAEVDGRQFAFIGLERVGGVIVYEVTNPVAPQFIQYINTRRVDGIGGDLSPEGLSFIPASASPTGRPLLAVAYKVSGTVALFGLRLSCPIASLPGEVPFCEGEEATLQVSGVYDEFLWSTGETSPSISVNEPGMYTVTATTPSGCVAMDTVLATSVPPPAVGLGSEISACVGEMVMLDAGPGYSSYSWSNGQVGQSISVTVGGTYSVTVTDAFGCAGGGSAEVVFHPLPVSGFPQDTTICSGDITVFSPGPGNVFLIDGVAQDAFVVAGFAPAIYSVEAVVVSAFGCQSPVVLNFEVDVCVGAEEAAEAAGFELFPNPASGAASVRLRHLKEAIYRLEVFDAAGLLVYQRRIFPLAGEYREEIALAGMPAGIYLVRLAGGGGLVSKRLVVE